MFIFFICRYQTAMSIHCWVLFCTAPSWMCLSKCEASTCHFVEHILFESISSRRRSNRTLPMWNITFKLQCCQSMPIQIVRIIDIDINIDIVRFAKQNPVMLRKIWVLLPCYMSSVIASLLFDVITVYFKISLQLHRNTIHCDKVLNWRNLKSFTPKNMILTRSIRFGSVRNKKNAQKLECVFFFVVNYHFIRFVSKNHQTFLTQRERYIVCTGWLTVNQKRQTTFFEMWSDRI